MYVSVPVTAAAAGLGLPPGASAQPPWCGGIAPLKQMLTDLGFYLGPIDSNFDKATDSAVASFARSKGVAYRSGVLSSELCAKMAAAWESRFGVKKIDVRRVSQQFAQRALVTPKGDEQLTLDQEAFQCQIQGKVWDPATRTCSKPPPAQQQTSFETPADELGPVEQCLLAGGGWLDGECVYPETGERMEYQPRDEAGVQVAEPGWWERQDTGVKVAIIGGGVLVAGGIIFAVTR
jgi:hypothetical protein